MKPRKTDVARPPAGNSVKALQDPTATDHHPVSRHPAVEQKAGLAATRGTVGLAGRIAGWTSKGVVTGIILVAGLAFGRQVHQWWSEGEQSEAGAIEHGIGFGGLGDETVEHELHFGDQPWAMRRQEIGGDLKAAAAMLSDKCRQACISSPDVPAAPGPQEQALLESLGEREPILQMEGGWAVYQFDEAVPMVVGVRPAVEKAAPSGGRNVAGTDLRVVSWGFGVPSSTGGWTLYTFVAALPSGGGAPGGPELPLPADCRRTISVRVAGGGGIVAFRGPRQPETWKACYDQFFEQRGWVARQRWQARGSRWSRGYRHPKAGSVDVQFGPDDRGGMTGLVTITSGAAGPAESESS